MVYGLSHSDASQVGGVWTTVATASAHQANQADPWLLLTHTIAHPTLVKGIKYTINITITIIL
jgi:hypothetical protein